jgi:glucose-6-phosphate 1-epimerase
VHLLDRGLRLELQVHNPQGESEFSFTGCFHTYFRFKDTSTVTLHGLNDTKFIDKADGRKVKLQDGTINVKREADRSAKEAGIEQGFVDRIYLESPNLFEFRDDANVLYKIEQSPSWTDTTVYNPWLGDKQGPKFPDFDDDGYKYTIACEPTLSAAHAVTLRGGESWQGYQEITVPSS